MSIEAHNYVIRLKVGNLTAKFALTRLADRADERFSCWPSIPLLAAEMEKSDRTAQRALDLLVELGLVSDKPEFRPDGSQKSNRYFLHGPWDDYAGTGVPFPEIVTPKQARADLWAQASAEAPFREGTAAAVAISADKRAAEERARRAAEVAAERDASKEAQRARGRKAAAARRAKQEAGQDTAAEPVDNSEGVTCMSPPPLTCMSPPGVSPMSPLEPSAITLIGSDVVPDGRRPPQVVARAREGGSAASSKIEPGERTAPRPADGPSKAKTRLTPYQRRQVDAVLAHVPPFLADQVPSIPVVWAGVLDALAVNTPRERTVGELAGRIARRWSDHGWAAKALAGEEIRKPVGVFLDLLRDYGSQDRFGCADPRCEGGISLDSGMPCVACRERSVDRWAERALTGAQTAAEVPSQGCPVEEAGPAGAPRPLAVINHADVWAECGNDWCGRALPKAQKSGLCWSCKEADALV